MIDALSRPLLYSFRRCPYAMRARMGLFAAGKEVELREIVLRDKPVHMLEISPKGTVPVLQLTDGTVLEESLDIMLWALGQNDPDGWLTPEKGSLDDMSALIDEIDGAFKHHLDRYKYATRYEGADEMVHRSLAMVALAPLVARLERTSQLFGSLISLADIALFPFVRQFANTDRVWFDENVPDVLQTWLQSHEKSDLFAIIFQKWSIWQEGGEVTLFPSSA